MKQLQFILVLIFLATHLYAQDTTKTILSKAQTDEILKKIKPDSLSYVKSSSESACKCIDSITISGKSGSAISKEIAECIHKEVLSYQLSKKFFSIISDTGRVHNISLSDDKESKEYKRNYYEIERWLRDSCNALRERVVADNQESKHSVSTNKEALKFYELGNERMQEGSYATALPNFEKAVRIDSMFAFCWDNIGICNRKLGRYAEALKAYNKSRLVDPSGITPLQNIPVVYEHEEKYEEALAAYKKLISIFKKDPEGYYGAGRMYYQLEDLDM